MTDDPSLERIEKALADLGQEYRSPPGWEDRVRAATRRSGRRRWIALGAVVAAAAAVFSWWLVSGRQAAPPRLAFEHSLTRGDDRMRGGESARLGDTLHATVRGGGNRALWLYEGDRLVHACPGPTGCASSDRVLSLEVKLESPGRYTLVGLRDDAPLPAPKAGFDEDLAAAQRAGASTDRYEFVVE